MKSIKILFILIILIVSAIVIGLYQVKINDDQNISTIINFRSNLSAQIYSFGSIKLACDMNSIFISSDKKGVFMLRYVLNPKNRYNVVIIGQGKSEKARVRIRYISHRKIYLRRNIYSGQLHVLPSGINHLDILIQVDKTDYILHNININPIVKSIC